MTKITLSVPDISCDHCKQSIQGAVGKLEGVNTVNVHIDPRTVDVEFDDNRVNRESIVKSIEGQGFPVAS